MAQESLPGYRKLPDYDRSAFWRASVYTDGSFFHFSDGLAHRKGKLMFQKLFGLKEKGTTVKTELLAGLTTFLTMAYILAVNPGILSDGGVPFQAAFLATAWFSLIAVLDDRT